MDTKLHQPNLTTIRNATVCQSMTNCAISAVKHLLISEYSKCTDKVYHFH